MIVSQSCLRPGEEVQTNRTSHSLIILKAVQPPISAVGERLYV